MNQLEIRDILRASKEDLLAYLKAIKGVTIKHGNMSWLLLPKKTYGNVCLVSHVDTVFDSVNIYYHIFHYKRKIEKKEKKIFFDNKEGVFWSPSGLGADDRAGVYACLRIFFEMEDDYKPVVLLTDFEETGCLGAREAVSIWQKELSNVNFFIEIDRKGKKDAIFYNNEPADFRRYIESFGFLEAQGICSDISVICPALHICGVNLSSGYYNNHEKNEYLVVSELEATIEKVKEMLRDNYKTNKKWQLPKKSRKSWLYFTNTCRNCGRNLYDYSYDYDYDYYGYCPFCGHLNL